MKDKKKDDELFLAIEHAIDAYLKFGGRDFTEDRKAYDLGYEVKLSIKKVTNK